MFLNAPLIASLLYALCFATSLGCAYLLLRAYGRRKSPVLLWTGVSFGLLALNNLMVFVDLVLLPHTDLWLWRRLTALTAIVVLLYGFLWRLDP